MEPDDNSPDCFDLNDWIVLKYPEFHKAIKYLIPSLQYRVSLRFWMEKGKPDITGIWEV
jgi:hypothetical protein